MNFHRTYRLEEIAQILGIPQPDNPSFEVTGLNEVHRVRKGDIMFVDHPKYYEKALTSSASAVIINQKTDAPEGKALIFHEAPFDAFNQLANHFLGLAPQKEAVVGLGSFVHPSASLGSDVVIGTGCHIGAGAIIGDRTQIGDRAIIGAATVLGSNAFYYKKKEEVFHQMKTCGRVVIEADVELGAGVTIDAGVTSDTRIGKGSKLDNQVHVGHDVEIGENCLFAAQVGIAGCVTIGNDVTLWGQVGIVSGINIANNVTVLGQSGVMNNLEEGQTYFGSPASKRNEKFKELAAIRKLPELLNKLKQEK